MASSFSSLWPDPKSPVLSKIDFGVPLVELFKWLDVRDTLLGENLKKRDITAALALARDCKHPDAEWLTSIFEGKNVSTKEEATKVLLTHQDDARALCFAWCLSDEEERDDELAIRRASAMGNAFACSLLCAQVLYRNEEEAFRLAQIAAAMHERDGFRWLGFCFRRGVGCEKHFNLAKENFLIAAELRHVSAVVWLGDLLGESDSACWFWYGRAALCGLPFSFLGSFSKQVKDFFSGSRAASSVFVIGSALKGNIDSRKKEIFKDGSMFNSLIGPAHQAVSFYDTQMNGARLAVDTWTLVSMRLHLIKDVRIFIGKMIWDSRFEANYKVENDPAPRASPERKRYSQLKWTRF